MSTMMAATRRLTLVRLVGNPSALPAAIPVASNFAKPLLVSEDHASKPVIMGHSPADPGHSRTLWTCAVHMQRVEAARRLQTAVPAGESFEADGSHRGTNGIRDVVRGHAAAV
jgi:hypothetical protein